MPKVDRLDMVIALLEEAKTEKYLLIEFAKDESKLPPYGDPHKFEAINKFYEKWDKIPRKSVVNDNIKMARRLLLDEYV